MDRIEIKTLIDVTNTRVSRPVQGNQLEQDQYKNFVTLLQCVEIRSVISYEHDPLVEEIDIDDLGFGSNYQGIHRVWTFIIEPDREGVYTDSRGNIIGLLFEDIHQVPVIKSLTETVNIDKSVFDTRHILFKNTIIKALSGNI
jgi:hypothetical protein